MLENPYMLMVSPSHRIIARSRIRDGMDILDLGCGAGRIAVPAAEACGSSGHVLAFDFQQKMLNKTRARMRAHGVNNIELQQGDLSKLEISSEVYDRIFLVTVLGEIPEPVWVLRRICDLLKADGELSVTEVLPDPCYISKRRLIALCQEAGLEPIREFCDVFAYTLDFRLKR